MWAERKKSGERKIIGEFYSNNNQILFTSFSQICASVGHRQYPAFCSWLQVAVLNLSSGPHSPLEDTINWEKYILLSHFSPNDYNAIYQINTTTNGLQFFMAKEEACVAGKLQQWRLVNYFRQFQVTVCTKGIISALIDFLKPETIVTLAFRISLKFLNYLHLLFFLLFLKHMFSLKNTIKFLITVLYFLFWTMRQLICFFHIISIQSDTFFTYVVCSVCLLTNIWYF